MLAINLLMPISHNISHHKYILIVKTWCNSNTTNNYNIHADVVLLLVN